MTTQNRPSGPTDDLGPAQAPGIVIDPEHMPDSQEDLDLFDTLCRKFLDIAGDRIKEASREALESTTDSDTEPDLVAEVCISIASDVLEDLVPDPSTDGLMKLEAAANMEKESLAQSIRKALPTINEEFLVCEVESQITNIVGFWVATLRECLRNEMVVTLSDGVFPHNLTEQKKELYCELLQQRLFIGDEEFRSFIAQLRDSIIQDSLSFPRGIVLSQGDNGEFTARRTATETQDSVSGPSDEMSAGHRLSIEHYGFTVDFLNEVPMSVNGPGPSDLNAYMKYYLDGKGMTYSQRYANEPAILEVSNSTIVKKIDRTMEEIFEAARENDRERVRKLALEIESLGTLSLF
ncbi:MAG: hypothetical protein GWP15_01215 [Nitrospirae bacterium]|nr:hypothetical protein [Nitrospirota bacterium]